MNRTVGNVLVFGPSFHRSIERRSLRQKGGLYANPLEMATQCAVACSEAKDDGLLVSWQLVECVLVRVVSSSFTEEDDFLLITDKSFDFSVGQM